LNLSREEEAFVKEKKKRKKKKHATGLWVVDRRPGWGRGSKSRGGASQQKRKRRKGRNAVGQCHGCRPKGGGGGGGERRKGGEADERSHSSLEFFPLSGRENVGRERRGGKEGEEKKRKKKKEKRKAPPRLGMLASFVAVYASCTEGEKEKRKKNKRKGRKTGIG